MIKEKQDLKEILDCVVFKAKKEKLGLKVIWVQLDQREIKVRVEFKERLDKKVNKDYKVL